MDGDGEVGSQGYNKEVQGGWRRFGCQNEPEKPAEGESDDQPILFLYVVYTIYVTCRPIPMLIWCF